MTADATLPASDDLTPEVLARWEELAAKATAGPWQYTYEHVIEGYDGSRLTMVVNDDPEDGDAGVLKPEDSTFIASARTAVPALLSGVRSRDARIAELEGVIARALAEADDWSKSPPGESAPTRAVGDLFADILRPGASNG